MYEYYSNVNINMGRKSGELKFSPDIDEGQQLGTASVDIPIQWVKEIDVGPERLDELKTLKGESELGYIGRFFYSKKYPWGIDIDKLPRKEREKLLFRRLLNRERRLKFTEKNFEQLDKSSKLIHPKISPDGKFWYLNVSKIYMVQYKSRLSFPKDIQIDLSRRSSIARCGLDSLGWFYQQGVLKEVLLPYVDMKIYVDDYLSQVSFRHESNDVSALLDQLIKDRRTSIRNNAKSVTPYIVEKSTAEKSVGYKLTLNPNVRLFKGRIVDPKHIVESDYVSFRLGNIFYDSYSFMLASSMEKIRMGPHFTGEVHTFTGMPGVWGDLASYSLESSIHAPHVWPLSNHSLTYEIGGDRGYVFNRASFDVHNVTTFLEINRVKTPAVETDKQPAHRYNNGMLP